jgi:hypothetical protein
VIVDQIADAANAKVLIQKSQAKTMTATLSNVPESKIKKLRDIGAEVLTIRALMAVSIYKIREEVRSRTS